MKNRSFRKVFECAISVCVCVVRVYTVSTYIIVSVYTVSTIYASPYLQHYWNYGNERPVVCLKQTILRLSYCCIKNRFGFVFIENFNCRLLGGSAVMPKVEVNFKRIVGTSHHHKGTEKPLNVTATLMKPSTDPINGIADCSLIAQTPIDIPR